VKKLKRILGWIFCIFFFILFLAAAVDSISWIKLNASKYHVAGCRYLKSDIEISLEKALAKD